MVSRDRETRCAVCDEPYDGREHRHEDVIAEDVAAEMAEHPVGGTGSEPRRWWGRKRKKTHIHVPSVEGRLGYPPDLTHGVESRQPDERDEVQPDPDRMPANHEDAWRQGHDSGYREAVDAVVEVLRTSISDRCHTDTIRAWNDAAEFIEERFAPKEGDNGE